MGRRSTNSTKAGKFMNPTDQARKEARKKELKKNKLQRLKVRQEVIKQKDPKQIFNELEAIDKIEYDINNPPQLNVKVLQEKRRKLKDSWLKMFQFYQKEDPKAASELKALELDYERRRYQLATIYESVMQAQKVKLDEIPLPSMTMPPPQAPSSSELSSAPKSILKSKSETTLKNLNKQPPGPPSGTPPDLSEFDADEYDIDSAEETLSKSQQSKKIRFDSEETRPVRAAIPPPPSLITPTITSNIPIQVAASILPRPTLMQPPPPPPPPIPQVTSLSQAAQYQQISKSIQQQIARQAQQQQSAQSYYQQQQAKANESVQAAATTAQSTQLTIQAKPVIRNKMAEITRFVPTSLVVKRTDGAANTAGVGKKQPIHSQSNIASQQTSGMQQGPYNYMLQQQQQYATLNPLTTYRSSSGSTLSNLHHHQYEATSATSIQPIINSTTPTAKRIDPTDAAYASFMKEIGKLL